MDKSDIYIRIETEARAEGGRLDKTLSELQPDRSRSYWQKIIEEGRVTVDGRRVRASRKLKEGEVIEAYLPPATELLVEPEDIPLSILFEDEDVLVIDKPKNMVVHPAPGHMSGTVVNAVLYHCRGQLSGINGVLRPGIVHRIDKDTTGSLMICKNDSSHRALAKQLAEHSIERSYRALIWGNPLEDEFTVDQPIGRDPRDRKRMAIAAKGEGKNAITHVRVLERFEKLSYIECRLETGRTHQIRVHLSHLGYPLLGDGIYGRFRGPADGIGDEAAEQKRMKKELAMAGIPQSAAKDMRGQCLHAMRLGFTHPESGERIIVDAPLPEYFENLFTILGENFTPQNDFFMIN